ncbi:molybdopterin-guanine dinucleotide biosynthesis protein MobA [Salmonella enterica]|uniref:Molybdopterin-guanine dinucleotide biosynthesis protein MobA n=1 Tax=Salmonella enterica TaxID=28901 RepID=A0A5U0PFE6_SALER|nr:molybdopterin-guanine dinucleotide biosynthesis protein MobA [Salmonella enterica]
MAIYSFQCKVVARTKRLNNAVAHAAYINRIDLDNNRDGSKWRYGHSNEDVYKSAVLLPDNADKKFSDPAYLWNEVEKKENRSNSRLARSFIIALPNEMTPEQNKNLIEDYIKTHMTSKGMIVNYAIHIDDTNNVHAHLMSTTRELDPNGLEFAKKNVIGRAWNDDDFLEGLRKGWADTANTHLAKLDHQVRIDHRTLSVQRDEALDQFEKATTAEAKAEALSRAVSLDRPAIQRIWRSKLNTEEGRALREAQQSIRDEQLILAVETKKSILSLPQKIIINNFENVESSIVIERPSKPDTRRIGVKSYRDKTKVRKVKTVSDIPDSDVNTILKTSFSKNNGASKSAPDKIKKRATQHPNNIFKRFTLMVVEIVKYVWSKKTQNNIDRDHDKRVAENYVFDEVLGRHIARSEYEKQAKFNQDDYKPTHDEIRRFPSRPKNEQAKDDIGMDLTSSIPPERSISNNPRLRPPRH